MMSKRKLTVTAVIAASTIAFPVLFHFGQLLLTNINFVGLSSPDAPIARYHREKTFWMCLNPLNLRSKYFPPDISLNPPSDTNYRRYESKFSIDGGYSESQASMKLAKEVTKQGKSNKAMKIYLHALALDPHNSDLLNGYGEFLETFKKDIVNAEHVYWKALALNPSNAKALQNHRRTSPLVEQIDRARFDRIETKLATLIKVPDSHPGLHRQAYEQYVRHIYHTTAMEGNTFTLSQTRSFVENRMVINGKSIMEHNEILGIEAAMHFLNSSLLNRMGKFTVRDITEIHKRILGYVDPIGSGVLRRTQVFVGNFVPPRPDQVKSLMLEFIEWLNSDEIVSSLHPVEAAALAHYKLVYIHPFYDGNGRTSRMLMNLILILAGYPPTIIPVEHKHLYYEHLESANKGDVRPFVRFIAECIERTLDEYLMASSVVNRTLPELGEEYPVGLTIIA